MKAQAEAASRREPGQNCRDKEHRRICLCHSVLRSVLEGGLSNDSSHSLVQDSHRNDKCLLRTRRQIHRKETGVTVG